MRRAPGRTPAAPTPRSSRCCWASSTEPWTCRAATPAVPLAASRRTTSSPAFAPRPSMTSPLRRLAATRSSPSDGLPWPGPMRQASASSGAWPASWSGRTCFAAEKRVAGFVEREDVLRRGEHVLLMLSGGADSMALLALLPGVDARLGLQLRLSALHVDYGARGADSDRDREIVAHGCEAAGMPL